MQIHELNTKALTDPAYVPFDDGIDTYKADFKTIIDDAVAAAYSTMFKRVDVAVSDVTVPANSSVLLGQAGSITGFFPVSARFAWSSNPSNAQYISPTGLQFQSSNNRVRAVNMGSADVTVSGTLTVLYVNTSYVETVTI